MPKRDEEQHSQSNVFSTFHHPSQGFSRRHPHAYIGMRQQVANHQSHLLRINPLAREVVQNALGLKGVNVLSHSWPPGPVFLGGNWHLRDIQELKITFRLSYTHSRKFLMYFLRIFFDVWQFWILHLGKQIQGCIHHYPPWIPRSLV